ncbi:unnamed protein product [Symbiodinium sp. CCMP2592]|nr:unnamed protein product [Symbiodinium sp. CCMP2592]
MLKVAQLETIVELQQIEIHGLNEWKRSQTAGQAGASEAEVKAREVASGTQKATEVLKKVLHKHNHQRDRREFSSHQQKRVGEEPRKPEEDEASRSRADKARLLQRRAKASQRTNATAQHLDSSVSSKGVPIIDDVVDVVEDGTDVITDGTGLVGDALGDAYEAAEDQVSFVANTVIDTVEMAVDILIRGFTDWNAGCDENRWPSMSVGSQGIDVDWGRQRCWVRLMGQTCTLFDFNFGTADLNWPEPLKTVVGFGIQPVKAMINMGKEMASCTNFDDPLELIKCFGFKLIEIVPPLSTLNRLSDMLTQFIEVFAQIAATVVKQVLDDSQSLIQKASQSKFPAAGDAPVIHHSGRNLVIKTHSQHPKKRTRSKLPRHEMSAMQVQAQGDDDDGGGVTGVINFAVHDQEGNYVTKLITQFDGNLVQCWSVLASVQVVKSFAATKADWQVDNEGDFIQLEPWAVPCDNSWMKDHWNQWQGYSFYTWEMSIEKCVTVSFSLSMQPVLSFVGGLEFDLMPAPLASLDTTVCWPDKQPGGVDLSVLRTEIRSGGILLFSRTLRLTKRFGGSTDFTNSNTFGAHETWRNPIGIAVGQHSVEDDRTLEPMDRTSSFLQSNRTEKAKANASDAEAPQSSLVWETDMEEFHLATIDYGQDTAPTIQGRGAGDLGIKKTSERRGQEAFSTLQQKAASSDYFQLFSFKNPGTVNFEIQGLLENNKLELGMKVNMGPFSSPEKRIRLLDIVDQFSLVLTAMPFVSAETKAKAILALQGFTGDDVGQAWKAVPPPSLRPGSTIALYNAKWRRYLRMNDEADMDGSSTKDFDEFPSGWEWERFTVVDAGNGQIALHSSKHNRFVKMGGNRDMMASDVKAANELPSHWTNELFTVVYVGDGEIGLHNPYRNRYIRLGDGNCDASEEQSDAGIRDGWTWERFRVKELQPFLKPGTIVALHNAKWNRFLRMNSEADMDRSSEKAANDLPVGWRWERFLVVDAENGQVALHSAEWNRFVKMDGGEMQASSTKNADALPNGWTHERFAVVPAGNGEIALHNTHHNRFIRMNSDDVDASSSRQPQDLPDSWTHERFQVVVTYDPDTSSDSSGDSSWSFQAR